jgi:hypothetical protein
MTDAPRSLFKHPVLLVVGALVVAASGCGSRTAPSASTTTTASKIAAPVTTTASGPPTTATTAAAAPGPHSKMLPEIVVPAGSWEYEHSSPGDETWYFTAPYEQTVGMLKAQLPIGQIFRGVPWCKGDVGQQISQFSTNWFWATNNEELWVLVTPPSNSPRPQGNIEFEWDAVTDGSGRQVCTAPLPDSFSAEPPPGPAPTTTNGSEPLPHSDKAEIDLPPGSWLMSNKPNPPMPPGETWSYDVSPSDMIAWLKARLPIGQPFHGSDWCPNTPQSEGFTAWEWIGNGQRFFAQVDNENGMVVFERGPTQSVC